MRISVAEYLNLLDTSTIGIPNNNGQKMFHFYTIHDRGVYFLSPSGITLYLRYKINRNIIFIFENTDYVFVFLNIIIDGSTH